MQTPDLTRTNSNKSTHSVQDVDRGSIRAAVEERPVNPLVRLEETFTGYVAALQARKGNIVGRVLRSRAAADELAINSIYNTFIENPFDHRPASEASVDVLFVAFEKYLRMAWRDQMGLVISRHTLDALQERIVKFYPGDFAEYVKAVFSEMSPQNRRAFIAIIKLLADLLEGCGNDGDKGALTAAFAELLVVDGNPHDYINLLDHMVEDQERLFEDIGPGALGHGINSGYGSVSGSTSGNRSNHSTTGSITSNASSLRRRFADTILRQNSSKDADRSSVWRTLSKSTRNPATGDSMTTSGMSKASHNRARSIESPGRRPMSRDRPTVLGAAFDDRPSSSHAQITRLSTIGASPPPSDNPFSSGKNDADKTTRKKRRSSLSDLKSMVAAVTLGGSSSPEPSPTRKDSVLISPRTPSPTKIPVAGGIMDRSRAAMYRIGSPSQKENSPIVSSTTRKKGVSLSERPHNIMSGSEVVVIKDLWSTSLPKGHKQGSMSLSSNIPTLRGRVPSTGRPLTATNKPGTPKLRLQNPQKLRERLQSEAKAINDAEASLHDELSKIGEEMARFTAGSPTRVMSSEVKNLQNSVESLENRIPQIIKQLTVQNDAIKSDLERGFQASEFKVKGLDQLYKESSAENELLYEKFNGELGKIVKAIKGKGKDDKEELVARLREQSEETGRVKKENARLRREVVTLRTLLKGSE